MVPYCSIQVQFICIITLYIFAGPANKLGHLIANDINTMFLTIHLYINLKLNKMLFDHSLFLEVGVMFTVHWGIFALFLVNYLIGEPN